MRGAVLAALKKINIKPGRNEKIELGERLSAKAGDRIVEIELESLSSNTTRGRDGIHRQSPGIKHHHQLHERHFKLSGHGAQAPHHAGHWLHHPGRLKG